MTKEVQVIGNIKVYYTKVLANLILEEFSILVRN